MHLRPGAGRRLFIVAGAGHTALSLAPLAQHIDPDVDVWCIQAHGLETRGRPDRTITAAAHRATALVTSTQPAGPYLLAGYSLGGLIALQIAAQLETAGHTISRVIALDPLLAPSPDDGPSDSGHTTLQLPPLALVKLWCQLKTAGPIRYAPEIMAVAFLNRGIAMTKRHTPTPIAAPITFIRARGNQQAMRRWENISSTSFTITDVTATHAEIAQPHWAQRIAETLF